MFGLQTLDVILGLVFTYLLLSLLCTSVNELIAQWFDLRATTLARGVRLLLSGEEGTIDARNAKASGLTPENLYAHPLIRSLSYAGRAWFRKRPVPLPSYIPSRTFALGLVDRVAPAGDE
jgi:hypothetical protein